MAKIAFLGLGRMGAPMATRLVEAGHDVIVWNRSPDKAAPLVDRGARQAGSPAEAGEGADAAITMLASPRALEEVLFGGSALVDGLRPGATLVEMSTVGPQAVRDVAGRLPSGVAMLDAPVLGSVPQATQGSLKVFVGGEEGLFERWRALLSTMGAPRFIGPLGSGAAMKLVVNSTLMVLMAGLGEAMSLGDAFGLDQGVVLDVLSDSSIGVTARSKRSRVESGEYPANFTVELARKDASLIGEEARRAGLELPLAVGALGWMSAAVEAGFGDLDYSAVIARIRGTRASSPKAS